MAYPHETNSTNAPRVTSGRLEAATALGKPQDPRVAVINSAICNATDRVRSIAQALNLKADAIIGTRLQEGQTANPSPVPNGALDLIDVALRALDMALDDLAQIERRLIGVA